VRYIPVDQCHRHFPLEPKTVCCDKFADELERYNLINTESTISVFVTRHSVTVKSQAQLCVCALEHQLVVRRKSYHNMGGKEVPDKQNRFQVLRDAFYVNVGEDLGNLTNAQ
jgi:hypothetical protein